MNKEALDLLRAEKRLEIIVGATHLFEEPGALQRVAKLAPRERAAVRLPGASGEDRLLPAGAAPVVVLSRL